ncbi:MAG: PEP-CTERM sorting domain-containing protein [Thermoguttaceae bacterium]|jgi:hypothetical protein|nr:PEP-CTERM sorting domain-containing protein [Thermoguttaceae bacterium]
MSSYHQLAWRRLLPALVFAFALPCNSARAIDLRIDFESNPGSADPTGHWNTIPTGALNSSYPGLIDYQTGVASGVALLFVQAAGPGGDTLNPAWSAPPDFPSWIDPLATRDNFYTRDLDFPHAQLRFSGLDPDKTYRVEVLGSRASSTNRDSVYRVNGAFSDNLNSNPYNAYYDGYVDHEVMTWRTVTAAGGEFDLINSASGQHGYLSAMRISDEQSVLIDLGRTNRPTPGNWNNITTDRGSGGTEGPGHVLLGAVDAGGVETSIKVNVLAPFQAYNSDGVGTAQSGYPYEARTDSFATGSSFPKATIQLEGLTPGDTYDVILFGSRADTGSPPENPGETREAKYTVGGVSKNLVNTANASNVVRFYDVVANAQGHIQIDTEIAAGSFSYLGVIEVIGRFASDPVGPSFLVDFGESASGYTTGGYWNNLATDRGSGGTLLTGINGLINSLGDPTKVNLLITDDFYGRNNAGEVSDDAGFPTTAQRDSFAVASNNPAQIVLENLHPAAGYDLTFFGSRRASDAPSGNLVLDVTINGETLSLDGRGNTEDVIMFKNILPDPTGTLTIDFATSGTYGYLGAMSVTMIVPEPGSFMMMAIALVGFLGLRRRRKAGT